MVSPAQCSLKEMGAANASDRIKSRLLHKKPLEWAGAMPTPFGGRVSNFGLSAALG